MCQTFYKEKYVSYLAEDNGKLYRVILHLLCGGVDDLVHVNFHYAVTLYAWKTWIQGAMDNSIKKRRNGKNLRNDRCSPAAGAPQEGVIKLGVSRRRPIE